MQTRDAAVEARANAPDRTPSTSGRSVALGALARRLLRSRLATALIIASVVVLSLPSLLLGFSVDEYYQGIALRDDSQLAGMRRAPWDLYTFAAPNVNAQLIEEGIFPWWTDPQLTISFFRPISALTLFADNELWGDQPALFHAQSILWYVLFVLMVAFVYHEFGATPTLPAFPLLLYALDDARSQLVGWISLRNAPIAMIPALAALIFHHRYRRGLGAYYGCLAPLALLLGLLGGEVAIAVLGYLLAYAVFMERGSLVKRALSVLPHLVALVPYRMAYNAFGFGALYSGLYVDPVREPLQFLYALGTHLPVLMLSQFAPLPAEAWEACGLISPWLQPALYVLALLALSCLAKLLWPLLRQSAQARFWALGSVLSIIPMGGTYPADRLLIATSIGASVLLADLLLRLFDPAFAGALRPRVNRMRRALGYGFVFVHCVFAPLFFSVRSRDLALTEVGLGHADRSVSHAPEIAQKTVIVFNPLISAFGTYFPIYREAKRTPLPHAFRYLASAETTLTIARVDAHTLSVRAADGFLATFAQRVYRSSVRPFAKGDTVRLSDMSVVVDELMPDGTPSVVLVRLDKELDDPSLLWLRWGEHDYQPFTLPKSGESFVLPRLDVLPIMLEIPEEP